MMIFAPDPIKMTKHSRSYGAKVLWRLQPKRVFFARGVTGGDAHDAK